VQKTMTKTAFEVCPGTILTNLPSQKVVVPCEYRVGLPPHARRYSWDCIKIRSHKGQKKVFLKFTYIDVGISSFKENAVCCLAARRAAFTDVSPTSRKYICIYACADLKNGRLSNWLRTGRSGVRTTGLTRFSGHIQTGCEAHPTSCIMDTVTRSPG
jgi:hypothetical protein